ncbi:HlyC/CorC family transporter [Galenea microaerophila]
MSDEKSRLNWLQKICKKFSGRPKCLQDLIEILKTAEVDQVIDRDALQMIEGVLEVSQTRVREVMVSRAQMVFLEESQPLDEVLAVMLDSSHSRYPVLNEARDEVVGVLLAKDVLRAVVKNTLQSEEDLKAIYRAPMLVPESKRLNVLLREFKASRNHMAIVVDEYGAVAGLVTIEDVLEQIVGEIEDEHDDENEYIQRYHQGGYQVQATTPLEVFNAFFHVQLKDEHVETLGGWVAKQLGHIPQKGEQLKLAQFNIEVLKADQRRAELFKVQPLETQPEAQS